MASKDIEILTAIGGHQALTIRQLSFLSQRSLQVLRRRTRSLTEEELIITKRHGLGRGRGRPEDLIFLTQKGMALLAGKGIPSGNFRGKAKHAPVCSDHLLLVNWFRIHLVQIQRRIPQLSITWAPDSYLRTWNKNDRSWASPAKSKLVKPTEFIPDGLFKITSNEGDEKALLFFLEVDMGTETIVSLHRHPKDIRQKILKYQTLFTSGEYKRCESLFDSKFNGFRLLFLVNSPARLTSLCGLVREMPPSDFIWLADQGKMFSNGLSAKIWVRGGRDEDPPQSILGSGLACELPLKKISHHSLT